MDKKFKIDKPIQELKSNERLWELLTLNTISNVKETAEEMTNIDMIGVFFGEGTIRGRQMMQNFSMMAKMNAGNLFLMIGTFYPGEPITKSEFFYALYYNVELLNLIVSSILGDKENLETTVDMVMSANPLGDLLSRSSEAFPDEGNGKEKDPVTNQKRRIDH